MFIDPHVHLRDEEQKYKETIAHGLCVAERAGFSVVFDMPNTYRPVTTKERVRERLAIAQRADSSVLYGLYMALTEDSDQVREAVQTYNEIPQVVGFKLYAGHSVGNIGVTPEESQRVIYLTLKKSGYNGVVAVHCEKESLIKKRLDAGREVQDWNPSNPVTHAYARPPEAEVESVRNQIEFAADAGFEGTLHIAHISVPEAVDLACDAKRYLRVTCGVTPHHLLFDSHRMEAPDGVLYKMNPPLRPEGMNKQLLDRLKEGKINWIETDHAPHSREEKTGDPYMSGIPVLHFYPRFVNWMRDQEFTERQIDALTFDNIAHAFGRPGLTMNRREVVPSLGINDEYFFDPFKGF